MSNTFKIIIGVVLVVIVAGGVWWLENKNNMASSPVAGVANQNTTSSDTNTPVPTSSTPPQDSDAWIEKQMTQTSAQMDGFTSDSASINSGLNDQPVTQGQ